MTSADNLLEAWREFARGKRTKVDVQEFEVHLMSNIISLYKDLANKTYQHSAYQAFKISDPKPRHIHKALVRDRLLHHALYRVLYPFFDRTFIADSYSCRIGKGTHKAMNRFHAMAYEVSRNHTRTCWVLKCDVKKFYASIDHEILKAMLVRYIPDRDILALLSRVIDSFSIGAISKGLPLGNLTSQLFCNIYMNEFDQFVKHRLKAKCYIRYADDFVILSHNRLSLLRQADAVSDFLQTRLKLQLHQDKLLIKPFASGVDFLGLVHWPTHRVLRTTTKHRMFVKLDRRVEEYGRGVINRQTAEQSYQSYLGVLSHANAYKLTLVLKNEFQYQLSV